MGEVWAAHDAQLDRQVAIKFLAPRGVGAGLTTLEQRFLREARLTARLAHPGVPVIHDLGKLDDGQLYLVMERVNGHTLKDMAAREGRLPVHHVGDVLAQAADILAYAHHAGVIHRDLKPSNLMLTTGGGLKVLDFGIAAALRAVPDDQQLTATHATPGTPGFMAPEQADGQVVEASDLYALGCVAYELLSGEPPLRADTPLMLILKHLREPVPALRQRCPHVPVPVADLVMALLAKDAADRPTPAEVRDHARAWSRVRGATPAPVTTPAAPAVLPAPRPVPSPTNRAAAARLITEAGALAAQGDHAGAAALLEPETGVLSRSTTDASVVTLRLAYLDHLRLAGAPSRALDGFRALDGALREHRGAEDPQLLSCRIGTAQCLAMVGDTPQALSTFDDVLRVHMRGRGPADREVLRIREEVAVLVARIGDHRRARALFAALRDDLRVLGPEHADRLTRAELLLARLDRLLHDVA